MQKGGWLSRHGSFVPLPRSGVPGGTVLVQPFRSAREAVRELPPREREVPPPRDPHREFVKMLNYVVAHKPVMANLTLSVPDALYEEMKRHPEIRWSEVARQALAKKIEDLRRMDALLAQSALRETDVEEVGRKVKEGVWKRHEGRAKRSG